MKVVFVVGVLLITLFLAGSGLTEEGTDFRKSRWGMPPDEVKKTESSEQMSGEMPGVLSYEGEIAGVKAWILFLFDDGKLERGVYSIDAGQDSVIEDYEKVRDYMLKKYGKPTEVKMGPGDDMFTGDLDPTNPADLYSLVLRKSVRPETIWKRDETQIYLRLIEQDGRVAIRIDYLHSGPANRD